MKIVFNINYRTQWGESLYVVGNCKELGNSDVNKAVKMEPRPDGQWTLAIKIPNDSEDICYSYIVKNENGNCRYEWGKHHELIMGKNVESYELFDKWNEQPENKAFYSSAFTEGIFSRKRDKQPQRPSLGSVVLRVFAPIVKGDEVLAISGDSAALGNWNPKKALPLNSYNFPEWEIVLDNEMVKTPFNYKFLILKKDVKKDVVAWEYTENRQFMMSVPTQGVIAISGLQFNDPQPAWKGAGTAIPVFSLRSEEDFGVGDFYDLCKVVDWAKETGQRIIQLLPINDTTMTHTWVDSYPYKANSTFALHPMYLRQDKVGD